MPWGYAAAAVGSQVVGAALTDDDPGGRNSASARSSDAAADATRAQTEMSKDQYAFYKANFQPLEARLAGAGADWLTKAGTFGTPEEQEAAAGRAHADATQAIGLARDSSRRSMASYGINPASGRFGNADLQISLAGAKADALAQNTARQTVKDTGFQKSIAATGVAQNIAGLGRGLPASAQTGIAAAATQDQQQANSNFLQGQILSQQQREGAAPLVNAASKGINKWWENTNSPTAPVMEYPG